MLRRFGSPIDAAATSVATFAIGLFALRYLDTNELALYTIAYAAAQAAITVPLRYALVPVRIELTRHDRPVRTSMRADLALAVPPMALGVSLVAALTLASASATGAWHALEAATAASAWLVASAIAVHSRGVAHAARQHETAAAGSLVQLLLTLALLSTALVFGHATDNAPMNPLWIGAIACLGSAAVSQRLLHPLPMVASRISASSLSRSRLVATGVLAQGTIYLTALAVTIVLGAQATNDFEALRTFAQPVYVGAVAVGAYYLPRITAAEYAGRGASSTSTTRRMIGAMMLIGAAYALATPLVAAIAQILTGRNVSAGLLALMTVAVTALTVSTLLVDKLYVRSKTGIALAASAAGTAAVAVGVLPSAVAWGLGGAITVIAVGGIVRLVISLVAGSRRGGYQA